MGKRGSASSRFTRLGIALGKARRRRWTSRRTSPFLGIKAGRSTVQELVGSVVKAFFRSDWSFDEISIT